MLIRIRFLGTSAELPFPRKGCFCSQCKEERKKHYHARHSSIYFQAEGCRVVIDCAEDILPKVKQLNPDAVLITHKHPDHYAKELENLDCPVLIGKEYSKAGVKFTPFKVKHSKLFPAVSYKISGKGFKIIYAPDILKCNWNEFSQADLAILGGSSFSTEIKRYSDGEEIGHASMKNLLARCKEQN
ncbi:unnamed protein product, partial [marine sediment metagenome]